jgi:hypothetical protein
MLSYYLFLNIIITKISFFQFFFRNNNIMEKSNNDFKLILLKRLLFEIKIIRQSMKNIMDENLNDIENNKQMIKNIQDKFYIITNNLYQM